VRMLLGVHEDAMRSDRRLAIKISLFNVIGLLLAVAGPVVIDPQLATHVYGAEHARLRPHGAAIATLLCAVLFVSTYVGLKRTRAVATSLLSSFIFLLLAGVAASFAFPPERPHMGVLMVTLSYALLSFLTVYFRQSREDYRYVQDLTLSFEGRLERLKATIATWQLILVYGAAGYLAFAVYLITVLWNVGPIMLADKNDIFWWGNINVLSIGLYSALVVIGPLNEAFQMVFRSIEQLSNVQRDLSGGSARPPAFTGTADTAEAPTSGVASSGT